jgi:hypothetical protein
MTRFFVNEREITPPSNVSSLDQILKHVEVAYLPPDSVVRQIHIDGLPVMPAVSPDGSDAAFGIIADKDTIEIFTGTLSEIAHESIREALEYLDRIESITPSLSAVFQISPGPEPFEKLCQLYEGFFWLNLLLDKLGKNFHFSLEDDVVQDKPVREHLQKFIGVLKQLIESQERRDFVLISDLLEYEIIPVVSIWKEIFNLVAQKVAAAQEFAAEDPVK